jgi:3-hydroxyisobutyrate dehydrogenase-like beta-hydroxyacid dehydrogenase
MQPAIIGLGRMGQAMAARILDTGQTIQVYNRDPSRAASLVEMGAVHAAAIPELCGSADIVITMLANDDALEAVCHAPGGLLANFQPGTVHAVMGTHSVDLIGRLAGAHAQAGCSFVCAPVLGRPEAARAGQLTIVAAGDTDGIKRARGVFAALSRSVVHAGADARTAAAMKLANNYMLGCAIQSMAEAFVMVHKAGGDVSQFREIITGGLFSGIAHTTYGRLIEAGRFDQVGFAVELAVKDIELVLAAGRDLDVPLPVAAVVRNRLLSMMAQGEGGLDWAALAREQARASGLNVGASESLWDNVQ